MTEYRIAGTSRIWKYGANVASSSVDGIQNDFYTVACSFFASSGAGTTRIDNLLIYDCCNGARLAFSRTGSASATALVADRLKSRPRLPYLVRSRRCASVCAVR